MAAQMTKMDEKSDTFSVAFGTDADAERKGQWRMK